MPNATDGRKHWLVRARWTPVGCERAGDHPIARLGAEVAWLCYARGEGARGGSAITALYTDDWRAADLESYSY